MIEFVPPSTADKWARRIGDYPEEEINRVATTRSAARRPRLESAIVDADTFVSIATRLNARVEDAAFTLHTAAGIVLVRSKEPAP